MLRRGRGPARTGRAANHDASELRVGHRGGGAESAPHARVAGGEAGRPGGSPAGEDDVVGLVAGGAGKLLGALDAAGGARALHAGGYVDGVAGEGALEAAGAEDEARHGAAVQARAQLDMASEERAGWVDWSFAGSADGGDCEAGEAGGVVGGLVLAEVGSSDVGIADDVDALDTLEIGEYVELLKRRPSMLDRRDASISLMRFGKLMISEKKRETGVFEIGLTIFPWSIATATM
jgi:hypothetical protein